MQGAIVQVNDRVCLRDRPWRVTKVQEVAGGGSLVEVEALDGEQPASLMVLVSRDQPLEEITPLPSEDLAFDLRQLDSFAAWANAHRILAATLVRETGLISGARFGRVTLEAYQLAPVLRVLSKPRPSLLIADDVGLGKTIEAGLILLELMARGRADRVLVVTPPGLMEQWRQELQDKFGLEFRIIGNASDLAAAQTELPAGVSPWDALPRVITSLDYLKKETVRHRALRKRWDLVIVDEAHALAESGTPENPYRTQRTRLGQALREASRGLILLTATPHNGYAHAFRSLLELVEPTQATLHGAAEDRERRLESARIRRMKAQIKRRNPDGREQPVFPLRTVSGIPVTDLTDADRQLLRKVASYCSRVARQAEGTEEAELIGFAMQIVKKRALSSRAALARTLEHRLEALRGEEAREAPPDRAELRDYQADLPLTEAASERIAVRILRSAVPADERRREAEVRAIREIQRLLRRAGERDPKIEALVAELRRVFQEDPAEKVIVFTEYRDTLEAIRLRLEQEPELAGRYVVMTGGLSRRQRLRCQEEFAQPEIRVLLATDAASEGLNLQHHCRRVIHFELPWNPNRLEQRNGRVDRYGQIRPPVIRYLYYPDSPEDDVLATLVEKIERMARDRISTPDILGVLAGRGEVETGLVRLDPEAGDAAAQKQALVRLFEDRTAEFIRNVQPLLAASNGGAEEIARITELLDTAEPLLADDRELEEVACALLGRGVQPDPHREGIYRIEVPLAYRGEGVKPEYKAATFRRSVAVRHRADEVEYLTPLHPLVRALAADARRRLLQVYPSARGLPPRRLATRLVEGSEPPSVLFTFLASVEGGGGLKEERVLAVRVGSDGQLLGDPEENLRWLTAERPGDVQRERLETLFAPNFDRLYALAREEAERWVCRRAEELRRRRAEQAELLRRELEVDVADRLREIEEEERRARGLIEASGQLRLLSSDGEEAAGRGLEARRAVVEAYRQKRLDDYHFALLQSSVHEVWLRKQASSLPTDVRYTPTDCFDTFPFPPAEYKYRTSSLEELLQQPAFGRAARIGAECHEHRRQIMLARNLGLTKTYNLFHDPDCTDDGIARLRELHVAMDLAVLACYGWDDLALEHGFYTDDRGQVRFTISPVARREILSRLLELNLYLSGQEWKRVVEGAKVYAMPAAGLARAAEATTTYTTESARQPAASTAFQQAAVFAWVVHKLHSLGYPVSRFRVQKMLYLIEAATETGLFTDFRKQAAGPYDPSLHHKGPEYIAVRQKGWLAMPDKTHFEPGPNIEEALRYAPRYMDEVLAELVLDEFRAFRDETLERWTTVHLAAVELQGRGDPVTPDTVLAFIQSVPAWQGKLAREEFALERIADALEGLRRMGLLPAEGHSPHGGAT